MDPRQRRNVMASMGLAQPIPTLKTLRTWAYIDDRNEPETEADGQFDSFQQWVNHAASWIGWGGYKCFDAKGRPCRRGADFMLAREEKQFPVKFYAPEKFANPLVPSNGAMLAMRALQSAEKPMTIQQIRIIPGAGNMSWNKIESYIGADGLHGDDGRILTVKGHNEVHEYAERIKRASYVR